MKRATKGCNTIFSEYNISIHALVKRATYRQVAIPPLEVISIHALVKRATRERKKMLTVG